MKLSSAHEQLSPVASKIVFALSQQQDSGSVNASSYEGDPLQVA
jgi:hypothetical protein